MAEDIKGKIMSFLQENKTKEFSIKQIAKTLGISYPTALKWVEVLRAEGKITLTDWGNIKLVKMGDEK